MVDKILGRSAYVICDNADGYYKPHVESPVRITPPYGTKVDIISDAAEWLLISFAGKEAWLLRTQLSKDKPKDRLDLSPYIVRGQPIFPIKPIDTMDIAEIGPRGGRFTRSKNGHKRYF